MSIKKFFASADATISNAFKGDLIKRANNSNIGAASSLELYSLFTNSFTSSVEQSRILLKFPISDISQSRSTNIIPASGSVSFYLRLFNVEHPFTLPDKYHIDIFPLAQDWNEGYGVDLENYSDPGASGSSGTGVTWENTGYGTPWSASGGSFNTSSFKFSHYVNRGVEDVLVDITALVEAEISGTIPNYGVCLKLSGSYEDGSQQRSYYTKRFSSRETNFFYSKPSIEARWDDSIVDDRGKYKTYLPGMYPSEGINNIYFYNKPIGYLSQINTDQGGLQVKLYSNVNGTQEVSASYLTVTNPSVGVYKASFRTSASYSYLYDWWYEGGNTGNIFYKGAITASTNLYRDDNNQNEEQVLSIKNLKSIYSSSEMANIKIYTRKKNWQPNIYSVATNNIESYQNNNLYYKIFRHIDNYEIIPYGTGSIPYTKTSCHKDGNYFTLDMSLLEPGYAYGIKFGLLEGYTIREMPQSFRFKVE